jgi:hypothetical protein
MELNPKSPNRTLATRTYLYNLSKCPNQKAEHLHPRWILQVDLQTSLRTSAFNMAGTLLWMTFAGVAIAILFTIAIIQNSVDERSIIATPNIPRENGVITAFASIKIKASADEVFEFIMKFKDCSAQSGFSQHRWKSVTADGVPMVGSTGSYKVRNFWKAEQTSTVSYQLTWI